LTVEKGNAKINSECSTSRGQIPQNQNLLPSTWGFYNELVTHLCKITELISSKEISRSINPMQVKQSKDKGQEFWNNRIFPFGMYTEHSRNVSNSKKNWKIEKLICQ
jgi:hypothetical protein